MPFSRVVGRQRLREDHVTGTSAEPEDRAHGEPSVVVLRGGAGPRGGACWGRWRGAGPCRGAPDRRAGRFAARPGRAPTDPEPRGDPRRARVHCQCPQAGRGAKARKAAEAARGPTVPTRRRCWVALPPTRPQREFRHSGHEGRVQAASETWGSAELGNPEERLGGRGRAAEQGLHRLQPWHRRLWLSAVLNTGHRPRNPRCPRRTGQPAAVAERRSGEYAHPALRTWCTWNWGL